MSIPTGTRVLGSVDAPAALEVLGRDPVESVLVAARIRGDRVDQRSIGGSLWGFEVADRVESVCFSGANLIPIQADRTAARAFAEMALSEGRRCSSIVGRRTAVAEMWTELEPSWGRARLVRERQPVMRMNRASECLPDPGTRLATREDFEALVPAAIAMYIEEIGTSPVAHDGGEAYRFRLLELIDRGRCYVRVDDGEVVFKAELGAVSAQCAQVQGVWVHPHRRGEGLGTAGTAAVVELARQAGFGLLSLYVNDFNAPAIRAYQRVGFDVVDEFMSVLF